ncbi:MAG: glycosyltransferase, partial [Desulfobacteraceae bacterium]|nr:glycosyltransferase [Desulfobacteraceae bacterium]
TLIHVLGVRPERIQVIYNGIVPGKAESSRAAWRKQLGINDNCFLAVMVANLSGWKDHATLLKAWRIVVNHLQAADSYAVLLLAGGFVNTHHQLKALACDLELGNSVRFLGYVEDIPGLLEAVDIGVLSSRSEGCPNGVLECMATGLAVAGTDIPGIREAVGQDGYPFLAPAENAESLADRILKLAANHKLRMKIGEANRSRIEEKFGLQRMCEETVKLIAEKLEIGI